MKVLFDHQIFSLQNYGGISRYYVELMDRFYHQPGISIDLALWDSRNQHVQQAEIFRERIATKRKLRRKVVDWSEDVTKLDLKTKLNQGVSRKQLKRKDYDVFHPTYYDPYFLDLIGPRPFVLTVYDMIHEVHPEFFASDNPTAPHKKLLAERASRIIAISESTKRDLIKWCGVEESRIEVIYLGTSLKPEPEGRTEGVPEKYLLFVGNRGLYKNFVPFLESVVPLLARESDLCVVCGGGGKFKPEERVLMSRLGLESRVKQVDIDDRILAQLYRDAVAFVFPSLYEGFGIPVLEAFACGCPALLSNTTSLPEVGGDAVVYFDPTDPSSMLSSVESVVRDEELRARMKDRGTRRLQEFSWERTARVTAALYEGLT